MGRASRFVRSFRRAGRDGGFPIYLDYPVRSAARYGYHLPPHAKLFEILDARRDEYRTLLERFLDYTDDYLRIGVEPGAPEDPFWKSTWFQGLDALALYGILASTDPKRYVEVGSGNSTKFARRAVRDHGLRTHITSIDPHPRAEIDAICDAVVRSPLEDLDLSLFEELGAGDIVFFDGSHRTFMNSDATVAFLDVIPELKPGVLVHVHDIILPWDYPDEWADRYYSEQYLLAVQLLAEAGRTKVVLPNFFVCITPELHTILDPIWDRFREWGAQTNGLSFWFEKS